MGVNTFSEALQYQKQTMGSQMDTHADLNLEQKLNKFDNAFNTISLGSHYVHISCYSCSLDFNLIQLICPRGPEPQGVRLYIIKIWIDTKQNWFIRSSFPAAVFGEIISVAFNTDP